MKLRDHPRWSLYCKLRRAIARELEAEQRSRGLAQAVTADSVDTYLEEHMEQVLNDVNNLFWRDLAAKTHWERPDAHRAAGEH